MYKQRSKSKYPWHILHESYPGLTILSLTNGFYSTGFRREKRHTPSACGLVHKARALPHTPRLPEAKADDMVEWHHQLHAHEFEQDPGVGDGQESLVCSPWGRKE